MEAVRVLAAEQSNLYSVVPIVRGPKRVMRHLWLVRYTGAPEKFLEEGRKAVNYFRSNPALGYPEFAEDLAEKIEEPYKVEYPESIKLPRSANIFSIRGGAGQRIKTPDFRTLTRRKIASDFPWENEFWLIPKDKYVPFQRTYKDDLFALLDETAQVDVIMFSKALTSYASVDFELLQLLSVSSDRIKNLPPLGFCEAERSGFINRFRNSLKRLLSSGCVGHQEPEVYYGRDARWLFLARKAQQIGLPQRNRLYYLVASRNLLASEAFRKYIFSQQIPFNAYHIDDLAGDGGGSGIRKVLSLLAESERREFSEEDFLERARFISAPKLPRKASLFPELKSEDFFNKVVDLIEAKVVGESPDTFRAFRNNRLEPEFRRDDGEFESPYVQQLRAWAMDQAVTRHFLPKDFNR